MAITKPTTSTFSTAGTKYDTVSAANYYMEPIATTLVGAGGSSTITFSNIPQIYTHLQVRGIARSTQTGTGRQVTLLQLNGDTGSNYAYHYLAGDGASATASAATSTTSISSGSSVQAGDTANTFSGTVIDILDYTNQGKYKTTRTLNGVDANGSGIVLLWSGLWMNTSPVTSIKLTMGGSGVFAQYSRFSLYGLRG